MSDDLTLHCQKVAKDVLPCRKFCTTESFDDNVHFPSCIASYRPAVAAALEKELRDREVNIALLRGRLHTIGMAGEFGPTNGEVVARLRELEYTSDQARQYIQNAKDREHFINELRAELRAERERVLEAAEAEVKGLREALKGLLLSADCEWENRNMGHDWPVACKTAREALLRSHAIRALKGTGK
jgi:hypothetical protein